MNLFRTRYRIDKIDDRTLKVYANYWWSVFVWRDIGAAWDMEHAMEIIKKDRRPKKPVTVYEE